MKIDAVNGITFDDRNTELENADFPSRIFYYRCFATSVDGFLQECLNDCEWSTVFGVMTLDELKIKFFDDEWNRYFTNYMSRRRGV